MNLRPLIPVEKTSVDVTTGAHFLIPESFFLQMSSFFFLLSGPMTDGVYPAQVTEVQTVKTIQSSLRS